MVRCAVSPPKGTPCLPLFAACAGICEFRLRSHPPVVGPTPCSRRMPRIRPGPTTKVQLGTRLSRRKVGMQTAHGQQSPKRGPMSGIGSIRRSALVLGVVAALLVPTVATASHGGGGGGGGAQPPPPPSGTPAVTFTPTSLTYGAQAIGTTSAPQSITIRNSGNGSLFINSAATPGANPLDFTQVDAGCSPPTPPAGTSGAVPPRSPPTASAPPAAPFRRTHTAAGSPHTVPITGTGTGQTPPLAFDTQFFSCANGVCDIGAGSNVFVNNFFTTTFTASGGTAPYTFSGQPPAGLALRPSGLLLGSPTATGTTRFNVPVNDASAPT